MEHDDHRVWNRRFSRGSLLRGVTLGSVGLAGAALLGCSSNSQPTASATRGALTNATPSGVDPAKVGSGPGAAAQQQGAKAGGSLRMGWYIDDVAALSPMANGGAVTSQSHDLGHGDNVVYGSSDGKITPMLWTSWEQPDAKTIIAKIRPNLKFQDDTPLDAAAMKASFETLRDPKLAPRFTTYRGLLGSLFAPGNVEVIDPTTIKMNLNQIDAGFLSNLVTGLPVGQPLSIANVKALGDKEFSQPRYHGPFTVTDAKPGVGFTSKKFAGYWGGSEGYKSFLDEIQWKVIVQSETRAAALTAKELDVAMWREADAVVGGLMKDKAMTTVLYDSSPQALSLNHVAPPFTDVRVRQALAYSIDRAKVRQVAYAGFGDELLSLVLPFSFGYKASDTFQYNVAEAKKLLAAAGNPNPKIVYALTGTPPTALANVWASLYTEMAKATGFVVETKTAPTTNDLGPNNGRAVPWISGGTIGQRFDSYGSWTLRASYQGEIGGYRANEAGDPPDEKKVQDQLNDLVLKGRGTTDTEQRRLIANQISDLYHQNVMGVIPVTRTRGTLLARDNVGGMDHPDMGFPLGSARPRFLWLKS